MYLQLSPFVFKKKEKKTFMNMRALSHPKLGCHHSTLLLNANPVYLSAIFAVHS